MRLPRLVFFLLPLLLGACASMRPGCADLPGAISYCLQATNAAPAFSVQQKVVAQIGQRKDMLIIEIDNAAEGMSLVGMTPFGHTLLEVRYDNKLATAQRLPDARMTPEMMLAVIQIALWPADIVQSGLGEGLRIEASAQGRQLWQGEELLMQVTHDGTLPPHQTFSVTLPRLDARVTATTLPPQ